MGATSSPERSAAPPTAPKAEAAWFQRIGCHKEYTRKQHRRYVIRVYRHSAPVTKRKHHRAYVMTRCQHTRHSSLMARKRWRMERRARARILRRGNAGLGFLMARERGWGGRQFGCLDVLWGRRESGWRTSAGNGSSGAYGIPQALPGSKMAAFGSDWQWNPRTQIRWGFFYIAGRYGTPCGALAHSYAAGWY